MRSVFNWGLFKGYLKEELSSFEYGFMKKVFSQAAVGFGAFGGLVSALSGISVAVGSGSGIWAFNGIAGITSLISGLILMFYYLPKYRTLPMEVTPSFVKRAYFFLILTYGTFFYILLQGLGWITGNGSDQGQTALIAGAAIFGTTLVAYSIPAAIGFYMNKHTRAVSLYKFLGFCYTAYLVMFVISILSILIASPSFFGSIHILMFILCGIIIFTSPILSTYRMKTVVRYLDESDYVAIKKWELFFVFEILVQLMQMAVYITRFAYQYCLICSGCRR
ncbi:hypothetical protein [Mycoplasma suis]|uniref:Uncharacterized protein n=2 Tax=Mycoplasma suis TaxID=57372 RepID=F0V287_MYCS3|nr:hypothetical protein [Mycoplasma suis]ADX98247.1 putative membrane protein [Mycoplasma suis str. Illinois]CBZ40768.1 hypothetical protein MSUIS_06750 [Mycoplasma suis KI3806]